jgi:hypothetical protein
MMVMAFDGRSKGALGFTQALLLALACWGSPAAAQTPTMPTMQTEGALNIGQQGTANYTLKLAVPPGTAGMAPALSLN